MPISKPSSHFEHALGLVLEQREGLPRDRKELEVRLALAVPQIAACGYAAPNVERTCSRARALCEHLGDSQHLFFVLRGLWNCVLDRAALGESLEIAQQLLALASDRDDPEALALAYRALGTTRFNRGEFAAALNAFQHSMAACRELGEDAGTRQHGEAPYIISGAYRGWALSIMGHAEQALRTGREALAAATDAAIR